VITAVDTHILVDILEPDPEHGPASREAVGRCLLEGSVVACEVVWAEVATAYGSGLDEVVSALSRIGIGYSPMEMESALEAARCWHQYRQGAPDRSRIAADFLIGGHAQVQCDRLLTRDQGFFRTHFGSLKIKTP
jgi:predicted nucleic acid-binding protein